MKFYRVESKVYPVSLFQLTDGRYQMIQKGQLSSFMDGYVLVYPEIADTVSVAGALPFWEQFHTNRQVQAALAGINAGVTWAVIYFFVAVLITLRFLAGQID
ncbi:hypothetical protein H0A36_12860 [Endozoicomonas sp. SM1973]|uniref:Uncharacterized protein n=1 Tax=Spartinivicinus marinus TaxID=2994442 RepID=A0A853IA17_9GAMM|nr:hypothetical protein [Spartinivicinus marinus]MCX4029716.1 hypothetical protein [Spartinivicinus marinus]NYZ66904.1 hypothetical protein [Spartinivicinus marinus]